MRSLFYVKVAGCEPHVYATWYYLHKPQKHIEAGAIMRITAFSLRKKATAPTVVAGRFYNSHRSDLRDWDSHRSHRQSLQIACVCVFGLKFSVQRRPEAALEAMGG